MNGMQNKTIKKVLGEKLEEWLHTIDDFEVQSAARKDVIVTGGSIVSMIMGDKINDYDVYFRTKETTKLVAQYYVDKFKQQNPQGNVIPLVKEEKLTNILDEEEDRIVIWVKSVGVASSNDYTVREDDTEEPEEQLEELDEGEKYRPVFLSENAITLSHKVQLITRFYGEPDQIHRNFDFVHACCFFDHDKNKLETPVEALRAMQSMTLKYRGSLYPVCSLFRLRKFISRGWKISAGEILKIAMQISRINLQDRSVLKEQLTGVDALYFNMLIEALKDAPLDENDNLSTEYIIEVIERIFNDG